MGGTERAELDIDMPGFAPAAADHDAPQLTVGHAFDPAEHEADQVADRVIARMRATGGEPSQGDTAQPALADTATVRREPSPGAGIAGGAAGPGVEAGIAAARGKGAPIDPSAAQHLNAGGVATSGIGVHTGGNADALCRAVGARAFSVGRDIFFARGQYQPGTEAGVHLIAHEAAHTHQPATGIGRSVRRRLAGTAETAERLGGGESTGGTRTKLGLTKNWDDILDNLHEYERKEAKLVDADDDKFLKSRSSMTTLLKEVDKSITAWRRVNDKPTPEQEDEPKDFKEKATKKAKGLFKSVKAALKDKKSFAQAVAGAARSAGQELGLTEVDVEQKKKRLGAVELIQPRIEQELDTIKDPDLSVWMESVNLTSSAVLDEDGNETDERTFGHGDNTFVGTFTPSAAGTRRGDDDPGLEARAVAMYRLDRLFGAGVTARAELAVDKDRDADNAFGVVVEQVKGEKGGTSAAAKDDAVLERSLNKLQILDAIAGTVERDADDYTVETDAAGNVVRVTGSAVAKPGAGAAPKLVGLPPFLDEEMAHAVLGVKPRDVEEVLYGLMAPIEVKSTVARFRTVQKSIREAFAETEKAQWTGGEGRIKKGWGPEKDEEEDVAGPTAADKDEDGAVVAAVTDAAQKKAAEGKSDSTDTDPLHQAYSAALASGDAGKLEDAVAASLRALFEANTDIAEMEAEQREAVVDAFLNSPQLGVITQYLSDKSVGAAGADALYAIVVELYAEPGELADFVLATQNGDKPGPAARKLVTEYRNTHSRAALQRFEAEHG
ncbi:eCIS core domain-containing protein [Jatrophihabitans fulvus]